jgi:short-subunit dehydrogenase
MAKSILITGASSGIGKESAIYLASLGYRVYAASRTPQKLEGIKNKNLTPIKLDITDTTDVNNTIQRLPRIDILINNAGYGLVSTVEDLEDDEMFEQFDVNLFGVLRLTRAVIPKMREQKSGVIINISSFLGKIGLPLLTLYNSSKYALEGITDSLRYELAPFNIRVHSIMPGFFDTNFARDNLKINAKTFEKNSPYIDLVSTLAPTILDQINHGNNPKEVAKLILEIIKNDNFKARVTAGDKSKKFIPMKKELSDEDFERRVREYYNLG